MNFAQFMRPEYSLPLSQDPSTCPCPGPHQASQRPATFSLKARLNIIRWHKGEFYYSSVCYHMLFEQGKGAGTDRTIEVGTYCSFYWRILHL